MYIKQWDVQSFTRANVTYKISMDENGNFACSCPQWVYHHKECKHIELIKENLSFLYELFYRLLQWRRAILDNHIDGVWDSLYRKVCEMDIEKIMVTLKVAADPDNAEEVEEAARSIGLPYLQIYLLQPFDENSLIKKAFEQRADVVVEGSNCKYFGSHRKNGEYTPIVRGLKCSPRDSFYMLSLSTCTVKRIRHLAKKI